MKNMEAGHEKKRKTIGWSTKMLEEVACKLENEGTEEMLQWSRISQGGTNEMWMELFGKMEEAVVEKFQVEETKEAYKGQVAPLNRQIVNKEKRSQPRKWREEDSGIVSWFRAYNFQRNKGIQAGRTEET